MPAMKSVDMRALYEVGQHLKCKCDLLSVNIREYVQKDVNIVGISTNLRLSQVLPFRTAPYNYLLKCPLLGNSGRYAIWQEWAFSLVIKNGWRKCGHFRGAGVL